MITLFVYGTLKKGYVNHPMLGDDKVFMGNDSIKGEMYSTGDVPFVFSGEDSVPGETWRINEKNFLRIFLMEAMAGYKLEKVLTKKLRKKAVAFFHRNEDLKKYFPKIEQF